MPQASRRSARSPCPLLLTAVSPLLIASFAFNFNNFVIVYLLTQGRAAEQRRVRRLHGLAESPGRTASPSTANRNNRAWPQPLSVMIFLIVAVISAVGFKYTKSYEEIRCRARRRSTPTVSPRPAEGSPASWPALVRRSRDGATSSCLVFMLFFALFPVYFVIVASFSDSGTLSGHTAGPRLVDDEAVRLACSSDYPYWNWFFNSLIVSVVVAFGTVFLASLAAYAVARLRFKGRRPWCPLPLVLIQMFPASLAFVAVYLMVDQLSDTYPWIGVGTNRRRSSSSTSAVRSERTCG